MTLSIFISALCYMLISSYTPGPGNLLALNTTVNYGWQNSKRLIIGIFCGYAIVQFLCTIAVYMMNSYISQSLNIIKYIGFAYIIYLAIHIVISSPQNNDSDKKPKFITGLVLQLINVKIYFYIITLITAYMIPYFTTLPKLIFCGIFVVFIGCSATVVWAFFGTKIQSLYMKHYRVINVIMGVFLLYCGFSILRS